MTTRASTAAIVEVLATVRKLSATATDEVSSCLDGAIDCLTDAVTESKHQEALAECSICSCEGATDEAVVTEWGDDLLVAHEGKLMCTDCLADELEDE